MAGHRVQNQISWYLHDIINYAGFPKETPELKFRLSFFLFSHSLQVLNTHARRFDSNVACGIVPMADEEEFMQWKISTNTGYNTLKTDTKFSHSVRSRPTLKDEERFRNGLVRKTYEKSLYERTFMTRSEPSSLQETCCIN